jgi:D-cysteine desulfhydrase
MIPLFNIFSRLKNRIPFFDIGGFPSPVQHLNGLCGLTGNQNLFVKRDDLCGTLYGGNKVRKLEFLIGDALANNYRHVITSGAAGSNHARATATYASVAHLKCTLMLFDQVASSTVQKNLLADMYYNATVYIDPSYESHCRHLEDKLKSITEQESLPPYTIPAGGSSPVGSIGFVNAGFELANQIAQGELPRPDSIFITLGTMGTVAGLLLGLKASGIHCKVHAVRVVADFVGNYDKCISLAEKTNKLLHDSDPAFPILDFSENDLIVHGNYFGNGYAIPTPEGERFIGKIKKSDGIDLDSVYTGKCGAAFYDYVTTAGKKETVLFWHTKNSHQDPPQEIPCNPESLPVSIRKYFT